MPSRQAPTRQRNEFTEDDDDLLAQYLAKYNPGPAGRTGNTLYERLVSNEGNKWPFSKRHTWQSWRNRYMKNQDYMDMLINKHIHRQHPKAKARVSSNEGASSAARPAPPSPSPAPLPLRSQPKRPRVEYTMDDDDRLAEYLAAHTTSQRGRQGEKLYRTLEQEDWAAHHSWQSWLQRYKSNMDYFDRRIVRIQRGEDDEEDAELEALRPRTVDERGARAMLSQMRRREREVSLPRSRKETEKRKRVSEGAGEEPARKRARGPAHEEAPVEPVPGPSRQKEPEKAKTKDVEVPGGSGDRQRGEGEQSVVEEVDPQEQDELEDGERLGAESDDDEADEEGEENDGQIGSEDYDGEIFDEPSPVDEDGPRVGSDSDSDEHDQEEAQLMLTDDPHADAQDDDEDMNIDAEETVVEVAGYSQMQDDDDNPFNDSDDVVTTHDMNMTQEDVPAADLDVTHEPILSTTPPSGASPPPRPQNIRIERDLSLRPDTPELSPAEHANARRHLEHAHSPAPPKKHATRIRRKSEHADADDFFGTPQTDSASLPTSALPTAQNSPTAHHLAHLREHPHAHHAQHEDDTGSPPQKRRRAPPRLDEGAWNKAFSDARGRPRVSPKGPRRSGVDFQNEDEDEANGAGDAELDEEAEDATPVQWPPVRGKAKGKERDVAPTTPARGARETAPGSERLVTTERIVSVKTVRTVERRSMGARPPSARRAITEGTDGSSLAPSSPRTLVPDDDEDLENERGGAKAEPTQHHPFSQPNLASQLAESVSGSSVASSVFPPSRGQRDHKSDVARLQKMLAAPRATEVPPKRLNVFQRVPVRHSKNSRIAPESSTDGAPANLAARLQRLAEGMPSCASEMFRGRDRASPAVRARHDVERRFEAFKERGQSLPVPTVTVAQSSPLARRSSKHAVDEIVPNASTPRAAAAAQSQHRTDKGNIVDKGKARADAPTSTPVRGLARRYTLGEPATPQERPSVPRHPVPQSLPVPPSFSLGDESHEYRTALSLLFNPPPSGSVPSRLYTLPRSSRSFTPGAHRDSRSAGTSLADTLPPPELEMVKELGMQVALACMARNHGFGEETVREVYAETRSLEVADRVLREMRESANERANETLQAMLHGEEGAEESGEEDGGDPMDEEQASDADVEEAEEGGDAIVDGDADADDGDSLEVESVLGQAHTNSWMDDEVPQAESSHIRGGAFGYDESGLLNVSRSKRKSFHITLLPKEREDGMAYSPPKKTRASRYVKEQARSPQRGQDAMDIDVDADASAKGGGSVKTPVNIADVGIGQLAKYGTEDWRALEREHGPGAAQKATRFALTKLLRRA
ncbi:hypothetical protein BD309DRAFT_1042996 [Dichomitus squalens]|uniref:TERF2-interacting telomeric protein 1 Myb domain-containing protein n=1 Tax=Dichomitus squalens TaxID=114155 RepID=A0A4Q9NKU4_9APHY|nr:hypothetical protein BD309DRAFT_1042996 [Dichomitus squalens]TBU56538.1 hypothetical protein BD310DRAFT_1040470 [Dichomitus squalens]